MLRRLAQRLAARIKAWRTAVVVTGTAGVFLVSVASVRAALAPGLDGLLAACFCFFALDWLLGLWQARRAKRLTAWMTSLEQAVGALAVWPIVIAASAGILSPTVWFPGILWLLVLSPAQTSIAMLGRVAAAEARPLINVAVLFFVVLLVAAVALHVVERDAQPDTFGSLPVSLYWAITTLTTTGYGDLVPVTPAGRLLAGLVMIAGIAVFGLWIGVLATAFAQESRRIDFVRTWEIVADSPFFKSLGPSEIIEIANMLRRWDVPAGTAVIRDGQEGDCMYFIASGQAEVEVAGRSVQLSPPAFFGELALLGTGVRTATVTTTSPAILLVLDRTDFRLFLARHPALADIIRGEAVRRAEQNLDRSAGRQAPAASIGRSAGA